MRMTEQEAIEELKCYRAQSGTAYPEEIELAIKALEAIQQYRTIGTVEGLKQLKENGGFTGFELAQLASMQMKLKEYIAIGTLEECRAAVDKQNSKKPTDIDNELNTFRCPSCLHTLIALDDITIHKHCLMCGQKIDWGNEDDKV